MDINYIQKKELLLVNESDKKIKYNVRHIYENNIFEFYVCKKYWLNIFQPENLNDFGVLMSCMLVSEYVEGLDIDINTLIRSSNEMFMIIIKETNDLLIKDDAYDYLSSIRLMYIMNN